MTCNLTVLVCWRWRALLDVSIRLSSRKSVSFGVKRSTKRPRNDMMTERFSKNEGHHVNQRHKLRLG